MYAGDLAMRSPYFADLFRHLSKGKAVVQSCIALHVEALRTTTRLTGNGYSFLALVKGSRTCVALLPAMHVRFIIRALTRRSVGGVSDVKRWPHISGHWNWE